MGLQETVASKRMPIELEAMWLAREYAKFTREGAGSG